MKKIRLIISAIGYEDATFDVIAANLRDARRFEAAAKRHWANVNDVPYSTSQLAFVHSFAFEKLQG